VPNPIIVDLSHHYWDNGHVPNFDDAAQAGVAGVIFKASQGSAYRDKTYEKTRKLAQDAGLLWGAYHFATSADAKSQVSNFLSAAAVEKSDLFAIDFERNEPDPSNSVSAPNALSILRGCEDKLGRRPVLYTGSYMYDLFEKNPAPDFSHYKLWWARYSVAPQIHATWNSYWLWQYTDGTHGPEPRKASGIGYVDCNHFEGTEQKLKAEWAT
jgi:lysozyme